MNIKKEKDMTKYLLMLINKPEDEKTAEKVFSKLGLPIIFQFRGHGTASSELLDLCGLDGTLRIISLCPIDRGAFDTVSQKLKEALRLEKRGHGIAAAIRITGLQESIKKILEEEEKELSEDSSSISEKEGTGYMSKDGSSHSMILVAAEYGYSEDIINAARRAGAMGGTVIKARRQGTESAMSLLGTSSQDEQELTMIIVDNKIRAAVMGEISSSCGLRTPAHGIVVSLPVEAAIGLEKD